MLNFHPTNAQIVDAITFLFMVALLMAYTIIGIFIYSKKKINSFNKQIKNYHIH